jgi:hypothetical protein
VSDNQTVDLIVELEEEPDGMWCGVSGGIFDLVPSECGKGLLL